MSSYRVEMEDVTGQVYRAIKEMILHNQLVPGQKIIQKNLAELLEVSRTPLQSAFSKLEKELLVEYIPRRGYFVRQLSLEEELELFEVRIRLEPLITRKAAAVATEEGIVTLLSLVQPDDISRLDEKPAFNDYDYRFHSCLMDICGSEILKKIISSFNIVSLSNQLKLIQNVQASIEQHRQLADAVRARDEVRAEKLMHEHLEMGMRNLIRYKNGDR